MDADRMSMDEIIVALEVVGQRFEAKARATPDPDSSDLLLDIGATLREAARRMPRHPATIEGLVRAIGRGDG